MMRLLPHCLESTPGMGGCQESSRHTAPSLVVLPRCFPFVRFQREEFLNPHARLSLYDHMDLDVDAIAGSTTGPLPGVSLPHEFIGAFVRNS